MASPGWMRSPPRPITSARVIGAADGLVGGPPIPVLGCSYVVSSACHRRRGVRRGTGTQARSDRDQVTKRQLAQPVARQERSRPGRAAGWRPGCTSTATKPSWRSHRVSPAPQLPAPSTPTRSMTPHCDGPTRRAGGTRGGGHDGDRAEMATKLIERRGDVGIGVGINPGRDERLGRWHRGNGRLPSLRGGRWRATGRVVSAAPAGGCLRRRASRPPGVGDLRVGERRELFAPSLIETVV